MKKLFAFILCAMLVVALPVVTFAESVSVDTDAELPIEGENAAESEISGEETIPEADEEETMTDTIVDYVTSHIEEISVIGTLLLTVFYEIRKHKKLNGSIGTLNNNAVSIAERSASSIQVALSGVEGVANTVNEYREEFAAVLEEIRKSANEKKSLEETLNHVETFLKTAKLATIELSNEVAELLVLANIPNSKKEELYARHTKAVHELEAAEEVMSDDGTET
jgi:hypothetical protein